MAIFTTDFYTKILAAGVKSAIISGPTFVVVADGTTDDLSPDPAEETALFEQDTINKIIFGKRINEDNIHDMIRRIPWVPGIVYTMYDHRNSELRLSDFYVLASNRAVYKCLNNNDGKVSTIEPSSLDPLPVRLADGYIWRYLFRLSTQDLAERTTSTLIPIVIDANTTAAAIPGSIESTIIENGGAGYIGVTNGYFTQIVSNNVFRIDSNSSGIDGFYIDSSLYVKNGPGAGQLAKISNYFSNALGRYVETFEPLTYLTISSEYYISPRVQFTGDGSGATGISMISNGQLTEIVVLDKGSNYGVAGVTLVSTYGTGANVTPIISPIQGHGADIANELYSRNMLINIKFDSSEFANISYNFTYARFGMVRNVFSFANNQAVFLANTFSNVLEMDTIQVNGTYQRGDVISTINPEDNAEATVIFANNTYVAAVYNYEDYIETFDNLTNEDGVIAGITTTKQPDVYLHKAQILCYDNINTITHTANTKEVVNIILGI